MTLHNTARAARWKVTGWCCVLMAVACLYPTPAHAQGSSITLAWDRSSESDVAGYIVYVARSTDGISLQFDAGAVTQFTYTGVRASTAYSFSVAAYTADGLVGSRSNVVFYMAGASTSLGPAAAPIDGLSDRSMAASAAGAAAASATPAAAGASSTFNRIDSGVVTALAALPDGRIALVEDGRRVRFAGADLRLSAEAALVLDASSTILSLAVDPAFAESRNVFISVADTDGSATHSARLIRYREVGGVLGQPAILVNGLPAPEAESMPVAIDASGRLYLAVPATSDSRSRYASTVLRFEADGSAAADNIGASPEFTRGFAHPAALTFSEDTGTVWLSGSDSGAAGETRRIVVGADGAGPVVIDPAEGSLLRLTVAGARILTTPVTLPDGQVATQATVTHDGSIVAIVNDANGVQSLIRIDGR